MKMLFTTISLENFNKQFGTNFNKDDDFSEFCDQLEDSLISVWYVSLCADDVIEDYEENQDVIKENMYTLEFLFIEELGVYISIY